MIYRFNSLDSTSSQMARMAADLRHGDVVITYSQTAGRGQRGNSWESQPGRNLTFSLFLTPQNLAATDTWAMSMAISVGLVNGLRPFVSEPVRLKWPNDIYVGDRKLCGILIENSLFGSFVGRSVVGIGINVNQTEFMSDAPNPVSLKQLSGRDYDLDEVLATVVAAVLKSVERLHRPGLKTEYMALLWRSEGEHLWHDALTGEEFRSAITDVRPDGCLVLGSRVYNFKEVQAVL